MANWDWAKNTGAFASVGDEATETNFTATSVDLGTSKGVIDLAAGANSTCAVFADGSVRCWGLMQTAGLNGVLGHVGDFEKPSAASPIVLPGPAVSVGIGYFHACAVLADGGVTCWGSNNSGQLGTGNVNPIGYGNGSANMPPPVLRFESPVKQVALGVGHTCALLASGTIRCWGHAQFGELGLGNTNQVGDDEAVSSVPALSFEAKVVQISSGIYQTCALLNNATVRCWGNASGGVLGTGSQEYIGDNELASSIPVVAVGGSLPLQDNWISNGSFETSTAGWLSVLDSVSPADSVVHLSRETVDAHGSAGALRVKLGPFATPPQFGAATGAYVSTSRNVAQGTLLTASFWAKRVGGDPTSKLAAHFWGQYEYSDPSLTLTNEWQFFTVNLFDNWFTQGQVGFSLVKSNGTAAEGEFIIDDLVVQVAPRCEDVVGGEISQNVYCRVDQSAYPTKEVRVTFDARAVSGPVNLAVTGWKGQYITEGFGNLDGNWKLFSMNVPLRYVQGALSFRSASSFMAHDVVKAVPGVFEIRGFKIQGVEPCEPLDPTNLVWRSTMKCDRFGYTAWINDQASYLDRGDLLPTNLNTETATPGDGTNSLRMTIPTLPAGVVTYTHNLGLMVHLRDYVNQGEFVRIAFDAKRTDPMGSKYLRLNRVWGGDTGANTMTLSDDWQHFELTVKEDYGTLAYLLTLLPSKGADFISAPTQGAFVVDNVRIERIPECNVQLDLTRENLVTCKLPAGIATGSRQRVRFMGAVNFGRKHHQGDSAMGSGYGGFTRDVEQRYERSRSLSGC